MELITEQRNPRTIDIDRYSTLEVVKLINAEDKLVAEAVERELPAIAAAVDKIAARVRRGGRLFYIGSGTSGRLGVLDASECPPTYGVSPELVQAIIAGGYDACYRAVEASEDSPEQGALDIQARGFTEKDTLVGIAASGRTPYTIGAIEEAKRLGALTIAITCNPESPITRAADISIVPVVGPEVIAGSTRMKAGTAQKMVLNLLSTTLMIKLGLVYSNLMSNLQLKNEKLRRRAVRILVSEFGMEQQAAETLLEDSGLDLKAAIVMLKAHVNREQAKQMLQSHGGSVRRVLDELGL